MPRGEEGSREGGRGSGGRRVEDGATRDTKERAMGRERGGGTRCGDGVAGLELRDLGATRVRAWSQVGAGGAFGIGMATRLLRPRLVREAGWDEKIEFRVWRTPAVLFLTR